MPSIKDDLKQLRDKPVGLNGWKPTGWIDRPVKPIAFLTVLGGLLYGLGMVLGSAPEPWAGVAVLRFGGRILLGLALLCVLGWISRWALNNST